METSRCNRVRSSLLAIQTVAIATLLGGTASAGWHEWSQAARNSAIVDEAASWDDGDDGGQCKIWVQQEVVPDASGISNLIPSNNGDCSWNYGSYVVGRSGYVEYAQPGEIAQMELSSPYGSGPHTFIVMALGTYGLTVMESNWCSGNCEEVGTRYIDYDDFYYQTDCYTIYYVL